MRINWKAILPYVLGFGTASTGTMVGVQQGWFGGGEEVRAVEMPVGKYKNEVGERDSVGAEDGGRELGNEDEEYRTSEGEGERSTQYKRVPKPPKNAMRVGCLCMDYTELDVTGGGACAGRGGVRFWMYQLADGSVVQHPTAAHNAHPEALNEVELKNLRWSGKKKSEKGGLGMGMYEVLFGMMFCVTVAYVVRLWFGNTV